MCSTQYFVLTYKGKESEKKKKQTVYLYVKRNHIAVHQKDPHLEYVDSRRDHGLGWGSQGLDHTESFIEFGLYSKVTRICKNEMFWHQDLTRNMACLIYSLSM